MIHESHIDLNIADDACRSHLHYSIEISTFKTSIHYWADVLNNRIICIRVFRYYLKELGTILLLKLTNAYINIEFCWQKTSKQHSHSV